MHGWLAHAKLLPHCNTTIYEHDPLNTKRRRIMKRSLAYVLATFLGLGLLSTSCAAFAQDAYGGITNSRGGYNQTGTYTR
jgi:hypothetical protein